MSKPRLVEVECIDHVIEQLKHVRDNYEGEYDEQGAELDYAIRQRDILLAELIEVVRWYEACLGEDPSFPQETEVFKRAREAIAKIGEGE